MPETRKKFTLATVVLNNADGLQKTWNSIDFQTIKDFEWLIQDGGSTDETRALLNKAPAIIQSEQDNGIYDAMNRLIERANGEYILFLNAGDALATSQTLELIQNNLIKSPDFVYGDALEESQINIFNTKTARNYQKIALGMFTHHQSMLYKASLIGDLRYDEEYKIAADYDFTARFLQKAKTVHYIPTPICIFEAGGLSQQQTKQGRIEQFQIRKNLNLCSPAKNHIITTLQRINLALRKVAPNLYWSLRQQR